MSQNLVRSNAYHMPAASIDSHWFVEKNKPRRKNGANPGEMAGLVLCAGIVAVMLGGLAAASYVLNINVTSAATFVVGLAAGIGLIKRMGR